MAPQQTERPDIAGKRCSRRMLSGLFLVELLVLWFPYKNTLTRIASPRINLPNQNEVKSAILATFSHNLA